MKQIFTEKHIGCPVVLESKSPFLEKTHTTLTGLHIEEYNDGFYVVSIDIAFIFRMLDSVGCKWVKWVAMNENGGWRGYNTNPKTSFYFNNKCGWTHFSGKFIEFVYFPSPLPWQESKFKRPDKIENESEG